MQKPLFFKEDYKEIIVKNNKKEIVVNLYCDEIKNAQCPLSDDVWHYCGILIVPEEKEEELLKDLIEHRFKNNFNKKDPYYNKNNRVLHYHSLSADTYYIAKRWFDYILNPLSSDKIYFNILGINESKINPISFGGEVNFMNLYNRFFRPAIIYPLKKYFYEFKTIKIRNIYHETGEQKESDFFPWHSIYRINRLNDKITCLNNEVVFLEKAHFNNPKSNFTQLIDIIIGMTRDFFHNPTKNKFRINFTEEYSELTERLINKPDNFNSKYCKDYCKRMNISFFPKDMLSENELENKYLRNQQMYKKGREFVFLNRKQKKLI